MSEERTEMDVRKLSVDSIVSNDYNPNKMTEEKMAHLRDELERVGYIAPILVRPIDDNLFEVVDGEHRLTAVKELGIDEIDCVVRKMSEEEAKVTTLNMNRISGDTNNEKMGEVTNMLQEGLGRDEMKDMLRMDDAELKTYELVRTAPEHDESDEGEDDKEVKGYKRIDIHLDKREKEIAFEKYNTEDGRKLSRLIRDDILGFIQ